MLDFKAAKEFSDKIEAFKREIGQRDKILSYIHSIEKQDPGTPLGSERARLIMRRDRKRRSEDDVVYLRGVKKPDKWKLSETELLSYYHECLATHNDPIRLVEAQKIT